MPLDLEMVADVVAMAVKDATGPLLERLAVAEAKLAALGGLDSSLTQIRERVVVAETKVALLPQQPVTPPAVDLSPVTERIALLEGKAATMVAGATVGDLAARLEALEKRESVPVDVTPILDRLTALEQKPAPVVETPAAVLELTKDLGTLRERLAVVETRGAMPGPAGKDGEPGKDGKDGADGLGFDDLSVEHDGERGFTFKFQKGDRVKALGPFVVPAQIGRGVYAEGTTYDRGDVVTWGGSQWMANEATSTKPGGGAKAWTLVVKCGRDGKDGRDALGAPPVVKVHG